MFLPILIWGAELAIPSLSAYAGYAIAGAVTGALLYGGYKTIEHYQNNQVHSNFNNENCYLKNTDSSEKDDKSPPYDGKKLGTDPSKKPDTGFEWRGGKKGQWHNPQTGESLRPDFNHPGNMKPHWDYQGSDGKARLNTDGSWEWKK